MVDQTAEKVTGDSSRPHMKKSLLQTCYLPALAVDVMFCSRDRSLPVAGSGATCELLVLAVMLTADGRQAGLMVVAGCVSLTTKGCVVVWVKHGRQGLQTRTVSQSSFSDAWIWP